MNKSLGGSIRKFRVSRLLHASYIPCALFYIFPLVIIACVFFYSFLILTNTNETREGCRQHAVLFNRRYVKGSFCCLGRSISLNPRLVLGIHRQGIPCRKARVAHNVRHVGRRVEIHAIRARCSHCIPAFSARREYEPIKRTTRVFALS